ncbi:MAG: alpha-galactosidase [Gemmatimonadaceae bacterium]
MTTRREFLERAAMTAAGLALPVPRLVSRDAPAPVRGFVDVHRPPDSVLVQTAADDLRLVVRGTVHSGRGISLSTKPEGDALRVVLSSPAEPVKRIRLRWRGALAGTKLILGDAWERGYGDLEWRAWAPDRVMPWYAATYDGTRTHAYGVRTGAKAFCFWQVDPGGVTLWADVRSGSAGVKLGDREFDVCHVVSRVGRGGETSFAAVHAFCRAMCAKPRLPAQPIYGSNDWYWAYGNNSAASVRTDAQHIVELSPSGENRPFAVIDDGWQPERSADKKGVGLWDRGNEKFPDMPGLAAEVRKIGARPGIWIRPLQATADTKDSWRLPRDKQFVDPTIPDVEARIMADMHRIREWGYDLIKHDYTTYDILGRWGFQMGAAMTRDGWTFAEGPVRTTAEVIDRLYGAIRAGARDTLIIGCNTVSHLSAGHFEMCRVGDDTSGSEWSRTRKMGVNTLAFRGAQHGAFYVADADCVGVTNDIPWHQNRQWLDLVARSGTMLFVSLAPDALGADKRRDVKAALAMAAVPQPLAEPLDWQASLYPSRWKLMGRERTYDWVGEDGAGLPP